MTFFTLGVCLIVGALSGIAFNVYILSLSCVSAASQNRTASQLLLFHLGVVNILIAIVFIGGIAPNFFMKEKWNGDVSCNVIGPVWKSLHIIVVWTITAINLDKYITISSPLHYSRFVTPTKAGILLLFSWAISAGVTLPPLLLSHISQRYRESKNCSIDMFPFSHMAGMTFTVISNIIAFIIPITVVVVVNTSILVIARHHRHRIVTALWDVTISAQATVTQQKSQFYLSRYRGRSAATTVFHHIGTLLFVYLPSVICDICSAFFLDGLPSAAYTTSFALLTMGPSVNGFVYGVKNKVLKKKFTGLLRRQLYKSEVNCEIQERAPISTAGSRRSSVTPSITLPFQRQLTRRMSEILQPPSTPHSATPSEGNDSHPRLIRQCSELSWKFWSYSNSSSKDAISCDNCHVENSLRKGDSEIKMTSLTVGSSSSQAFLGIRSSPPSLGCCRQPSVETINSNTIYNGGHRQSLRRALFAKNKQKSLDLGSASLSEENSNYCPPRSASHQQMKEKISPSAERPLLVSTAPLTPSRKHKKVSWSYDSVSTSGLTNQSSDAADQEVVSSNTNKGRGRLKGLARNGINDCRSVMNHCSDKTESELQKSLSSILSKRRGIKPNLKINIPSTENEDMYTFAEDNLNETNDYISSSSGSVP